MYKKAAIVSTTLIIVNIFLFLISHWAYMHELSNPSQDAWFSQVLALLILSRLVSTVIIGLFFRKRKWFACIAIKAKKYAYVFCMLLFFWEIYYFHHFEDYVYNFVMYNLAGAPSGSYYEVSLIWMFLYETFVAAHSWFSYIICWALMLFPRQIRKGKYVKGVLKRKRGNDFV